MAEPVRVTVVPGESEAEVVSGLLRANGIKCAYRPTPESDSLFEDFSGAAGQQEILVDPADLDDAKALLNES